MSEAEPALIALPDLPTGKFAETGHFAEVAVDVGLRHLDRGFDYRIPEAMLDEVTPGCRVKVRFAGQLRDGFVLRLRDHTEHHRVQPITRVVSSEPVLTAEIAGLVRAVADHWAGTFSDVVRLAVPPRHAATEKADARRRTLPEAAELLRRIEGEHPFSAVTGGPGFLTALSNGQGPRAAWQPVPYAGPAGDWARGFAVAAAATLASGRGSVCIVPDVGDLELLEAACAEVLGKDAFVTLTSDLGPAARYRAFLTALRGQVQVVIGTRAAAFAPVAELGLVALWDDGDDLHAEPRAPYPHARDVLALRASRAHAAVLFAGHLRTAEVADLIARDWLRELVVAREPSRRMAPRPRIAADDERALDRDPAARAARLPSDVFTVMRAGLASGPVLVQVPRAGYLAGLVCQTCREAVRCPECAGPVEASSSEVICRWAGHRLHGWRCPECGDTRWRAPVVGAVRTAEELGKAFPGVTVRRSSGDRVLAEVADEPALVVATPGAEPRVSGGYAAAVLLDTVLLLQRPDLRAGEEALRRWWNAAALVRSGSAGGTVIAVGPAESTTLQTFLRMDPAGAADRELAERAAVGFPPAGRMVAIEGPEVTVGEVVAAIAGGAPTPLIGASSTAAPVRLGPVPIESPAHSEQEWVRTSLIVPATAGADLVREVRAVLANRSAHKIEGTVRVRVDPQRIV